MTNKTTIIIGANSEIAKALSKPFQSNVPAGKLFTSDDVAKKLLKITQETPVDGELSLVDWQGKPIPW